MAPIDLPLLMKDTVRGKRSAVTCALKCASQCAFGPCNHSDNPTFRDIASSALSRRTVLGGSTAALAIALGGTQGALAGPGKGDGKGNGNGGDRGKSGALAPNGTKLRFEAIAPVEHSVDEFTVAAGFTWAPIIRWGDPLFADAPEFDWNAQSAEAQERQFGYNNDYTEIQEIPGSNGKRAVMFVNHEYTNENLMLPPETDEDDLIDIGMAAHGLTVVELERKNKNFPYSYVQGAELNRRILLRDEFALTGPAAGDGRRAPPPHPAPRRVRAPGSRRRRRAAEDRRGSFRHHGAGHPRQLRRRTHPVGDAALRRGELPRVLPRRRHLRGGSALRSR